MAFGDWELIPGGTCDAYLDDELDFIGFVVEITDREGAPTWQPFYWDGVRGPSVDLLDWEDLTTTSTVRHGWRCRLYNGAFSASRVYAAPTGVATQSQYQVAIEGDVSFVYTSGLGKFTSFENGGSGGVEVIVNTSVDSLTPVVRPLAAGVTVNRLDAGLYAFRLYEAGQYSFEINPDTDAYAPLFVFVNGPEYFPPLVTTSTIRVLTPGVWTVNSGTGVPEAVTTGTAGEYTVNADRRLHLQGGAYLRGKIKVGSNTDGGANANNAIVSGYGVVDATAVSDRARPLRVNNSTNVQVTGPVFLGQKSWNIAVRKSTNVTLTNIKSIAWLDNDNTGTPDGIDLVSSTGCIVQDSFVRSYDDATTVKSSMDDGTWAGAGGSHIFRRLVLFQGPAGNAMEIGWETSAAITGVTYDDIDVIHKLAKVTSNYRDAISIYSQGAGAISTVAYSNIRVEQCAERFIGFEVVGTGSITGVTLTNITFAQAPTALPIVITGVASHLVNNVAFHNLRFADGATLVTSSSQVALTTNAYATNVTFAAT